MSGPPVADGAFARWLASRAGQALAEVRADLGHDDPPGLVAAGAKVVRDGLLTAFARWRPVDAVLIPDADDGTADDKAAARGTADRVWIVDPLGGAAAYADRERTDWGVHVALWSRGAGLTAGAVANPARHQVLATDTPPAYPPLHPSAATGGPVRLATGAGPPAGLVTALGADVVAAGTAGQGIAAVVTGEADAYVHIVPGYEWDSAAPVAVATATGLYASRIDGSALEYNQGDPRLPDLLVCRKDLAVRMLAALRGDGRV
ncbi:MAG TPA: inositol monophosphatase family protein [Pilimelia sp.]|nr:inositol monophosphatase family protein [Pilimelia sp.]